MRIDRSRDFAVLPAPDGTVWLAWKQNGGAITVSELRHDTLGETHRLGLGGFCRWQATTDSQGIPWIVWSEVGGTVYAARYLDGSWEPRLQVSTRGETARHPLLVPDTYGNVWIFWVYEQESAGEVWMCRMGLRSGQETFVARGEEVALLAAGTSQGEVYVIYEDSGLMVRVAVGSEHEGFPKLMKLPPG